MFLFEEYIWGVYLDSIFAYCLLPNLVVHRLIQRGIKTTLFMEKCSLES